jgi:outer membrane protein OmpA-like peptidoglycan-associated protein
MPHHQIRIVFAIVSVLFSLAGPFILDAQEQRKGVDCRERESCTDMDLAEAIFPSFKGIGPAPIQPQASPETFVALKVFFEPNSATIIQQYNRELDKLGRVLTSPDYSHRRIRIEGHTDSLGSDRSNQVLSEMRAKSVKQYLEQHFTIAPDRLEVIGYGERRYIATNATPEGREKNRRIEVVEK